MSEVRDFFCFFEKRVRLMIEKETEYVLGNESNKEGNFIVLSQHSFTTYNFHIIDVKQ